MSIFVRYSTLTVRFFQQIAVEAISNIRTVASLGCEKVFFDRYVEELEPYQRSVKRKSHYRAVILGVARSIMLFAYAAGMTYGAQLMLQEKLDYGIVFKYLVVLLLSIKLMFVIFW